jgi:VanZ family protein
VLLFGLVAAVYLTLRTSCNLETIQWLPRWLEPVANWADFHGYLRNVPAYALLGVPILFLFAKRKRRVQAFLSLAVFAAGLELLQLFIPTRFFSVGDILLSWVGLGMTWVAGEVVRFGVMRKRRTATRASQPRFR